MKKAFFIFLLCLGMIEVMYSQTQNEFVLEDYPSASNTIQSACKEDGHRLATIEFFTAIENIEFETVSNNRIVNIEYDKKRGCYILCLRGVDKDWRYIQIDISKDGFIPYQMEAIQIKNGEYLAYKLSPKNNIDQTPLEKLARITVYDKDNKLLVGAVVKNKTGKVYGSTRYDGTLAINFENKGETAIVTVSHPSYSDIKEITVQAGIHDYKVYLRNYKHPDNSSALWRSAILPGWGQFYKNRNGRGTLIVVGETLTLAAGGLSLYNELTQKNIMDNPEVSYQDYIAAEKSYEQWNTARHISFITAAVIYSLNLVDAYLTPAKSQNNIVFTPNVMNANGELAVGATLSINF